MAANNGRFFPVQTMHLGPTGSVTTFNEATLNNGFGPFAGQLGMVLEQNGNVYRLVQFLNTGAEVAALAGIPAYWLVRANFTVTADSSDSESGINGVAGGMLGVTTLAYYCFLQIGGLQTVVTDTNFVAGCAAIGSATDGVFDSMLVGSATWLAHPVGISNATDSGTVGTMYWLLGSML